MQYLGKFWAFAAIFLGLWESLAFLTKKRIPTISSTCWLLLQKGGNHAHLTRIAVVLFCIGLIKHLLVKEFEVLKEELEG